MAGYSRENQRQNEALQSILDGDKPEKRIVVGGVDKEFKKESEKNKEEKQFKKVKEEEGNKKKINDYYIY